MILIDVNVYVYAAREDAIDHARYAEWLTTQIESQEPIGVSELVLSSVIRIVTNPRIFKNPTSLDSALAFVERIKNRPQSVIVVHGARHWSIFERLCREAKAAGNLITDAYFAALAIEHDCDWITADRDFARFTGLKWRHPF